jgi:predicted nucleic acid-binding protein
VNLVDSSGWLEMAADGRNARFFEPAIRDLDRLVVPAIGIYEVFKCISRQKGEGLAFEVVTLMRQGHVVDLDPDLAVDAARTSLETGLPMAGAIMLATARAHGATLWTQDEHFRDLPGVRYVRRR